jgi:streptogramin lyase
VVAAVEGTPAAIDLGGGAIWVGSDDGSRGRLSRIDAESGVVDAVDVGRGPVRITFTGTPGGSDDSVWTANQLDDSVSRVDLGLDGAVERIPAGAGPVRILSPAGTRFVWVANGDGATLTRIDLDTGVVTDIPVGEGPQSLSSDSGSVWTANAGDGTVSRVDVGDPVDVTPIRVGTSLSSILRAQPYVWVADAGGDVVVPIDPNGDTPLPPIPVGSDPEGLTNDGLGSMWVRSATGTTVTRIDMASLTAAEPIDLGGHPVAMAVTPGVVWVGIDDGSVARIDVESGALRSVPIGCTPVAMTSEREPSAVAMPLRGVWVACEDGAILRIGPGV